MIIGLTHLHSTFRYLVLLFLVLTVLDAIIGLSNGKAYKKSSRIFALLGLIFVHIQLLVGLGLYFLGAKGFNAIMNVEGFMQEPALRFYAVEHVSVMLVAIALITVGYSKAKRQEDAKRKFRSIALFYGVGLLLIFLMIPWPFLRSFGGWF